MIRLLAPGFVVAVIVGCAPTHRANLANTAIASDGHQALVVSDHWYEVVQVDPSPADVPSAGIRRSIKDSHWPWRVRHRKSGIIMQLVPSIGPLSVDYQCIVIKGATVSLRSVATTKAFYLGCTECSVGEARRLRLAAASVTGTQDHESDDRLPVEVRSHSDLSSELACSGLRLPTEAEWVYFAALLWSNGGMEYARSENILDRSSAENAAIIERFAIPSSDLGEDGIAGPCAVGTCGKGLMGFHDVFGNVSELCADMNLAILAHSALTPKDVRDQYGFVAAIHGGAYNLPLGRCRPGMSTLMDQYPNRVGFRVAHDAAE